MSERRTRKTNAHRLLVGLGGIGYTPQEAICDIVDNAVSAGAKNVYIKILKLDEGLNDNRRNNVSQYLIIDDGSGMTPDQVGNALDLGSDASLYSEGTLSKFGLGLKSASFANGDRLEIVSGIDGAFHKEYVDLGEIEDEYFSCTDDITQEDQELIDEYLPGGTGTIVRVAKIRNVEHPSVNAVIGELKKKLGVIYYYFIKDCGLHIHLLNGAGEEPQTIAPYDPLFVDEIVDGAKLDEHTWDGRSVCWLMTQKEIVLDTVGGKQITARVEMTQLPHPPTFQFEGRQKEIRERYGIDANNYGFYVYRNNRLISWADRLNGIIPYDQDFYSFRGRIIIDETADDVFNINVSKNTISLSANAESVLDDESGVYKKKSKQAWNHAKQEVRLKSREDSVGTANDLAAQIPDSEPMTFGDEGIEQAHEAEERARDLQSRNRDEARKETAERKASEQGKPVAPEDVTDEEVDDYIKGPERKEDSRIFKADFLEDNLLWEPYIDADSSQSDCVRISQSHRFAMLVNVNNSENYDMQVIINLLFLELARAETRTIKYCQEYKASEVENILEEFRANVSNLLTQTCKKLDGQLPPLNKNAI